MKISSRVADYVDTAVKKGFPKGCAVSVIYGGDTVYRECFGEERPGKPLTEGSIFRLFSLSKAVTSAAVMKLLEDGKIELRYPLKWFIPEFENAVYAKDGELLPVSRDITLSDLLTMRSGIPYPGGGTAGEKMGAVWGKQHDLISQGHGMSTVDFAREMGSVPLSFDPGSRWEYGSSADVLGAVTEMVSGKRFGDFIRDSITGPLGMDDTDFYVPQSKKERLVQCYNFGEKGENLPYTVDDLCIRDTFERPAWESGGAGLYSTITDYEKFVSMLLGEGTYKGTRILGRKTVELMRSPIVPVDQIKGACWDSMVGQNYGALMRVLGDRDKAGQLASVGSFGWDGWLGCYFSVDPEEDLAMLMFIQQTNQGCTDFTRKLQNIIWSHL